MSFEEYGSTCEDCGHPEHNDGECTEPGCTCGAAKVAGRQLRGIVSRGEEITLAADPFALCYVHDGGLPRVTFNADGGGQVLIVAHVCAACESLNGREAIRAHLQAAYVAVAKGLLR